MVIGFLFSAILAALLIAIAGVVLEVGIVVVALGYVFGGLCGGIIFLQVVLSRAKVGAR